MGSIEGPDYRTEGMRMSRKIYGLAFGSKQEENTVKRLRIGRTKATLAAVMVLTLALTSTALAGSGRNGVFNLGVVNSVSGYVTTLTGSMAGRMLQVTNTSTATSAGAIGASNRSISASTIRAQNTAGGPALEAVVPSGKAPMRVSSGAAKVANLNVDRLDNLDSTQLQRRVTGTCAVGSSIKSISATGAVTCESKSASAGHADTATNATNASNATNAGNADTLDGMDSTDFGRPIAFGSAFVNGALANGDNYLLAPAFTPALSGTCVVTASVQIKSAGANTTLGPFFRLAIKRGAGVAVHDNLYGHYFLPSVAASGLNYAHDMSRSSIFAVNAGEPTQLGVNLGYPDAAWQGDHVDAHVTYSCTTAGADTVGTASISPEAKAQADAQDRNSR